MGVDYDANFGLGFEIMFPDIDDLDECDWINELVKGTPYTYIYWGDEGYSGDPDTYAIVLSGDVPRHEISEKLRLLEVFLKNKGVEYDGSRYLVGGISVS